MKNKYIIKYGIIVVAIFVLASSLFCLVSINPSSTAYANDNLTLEDKCEIFTFNANVENNENNTIFDYEDYINTRFQVTNNNNNDTTITDEWIFNIIPIELCEQQKQDYLYIGKTYGFYFDYNNHNNLN